MPTILKFSTTGTPQHAWGESQFYIPHGLTIDSHGHFWVTDVALHQVCVRACVCVCVCVCDFKAHCTVHVLHINFILQYYCLIPGIQVSGTQ